MSTVMVSSAYCELGYRGSANYRAATSQPSTPSVVTSVRRAPLERKNAVSFQFPVLSGHSNAPVRPERLLTGAEHAKLHHQHVGLSLSVNNVLLKAEHKKLDRSISEPAEKAGRANQANSSRYKTELCRPFEESGSCKYGDKCQFAHGMHELRNLTRHPKYKTELCRTFHTTGFCPYGPRCHFIHNSEETKKTVLNSLQAAHTVRSHRIIGRTDGLLSAAAVVPSGTAGNHMHDSTGHESKAKAGSSQIMRPKAMSVGSFSIGSSGDLTPPSSPSGSPTSLGSFFAEEAFHSFNLTTAPTAALHALNRSAGNNLFVSFSPDFSGLFSSGHPQQLNRRVSDSDAGAEGMCSGQRNVEKEGVESGPQSAHSSSGVSSSGSSGGGLRMSSLSYPGAPSSPTDSLDSDLEHLGLGGSSPDPCCGSPLDPQNQAVPRLPTFARFANNNSLESE